jgi:hypothetical protein
MRAPIEEIGESIWPCILALGIVPHSWGFTHHITRVEGYYEHTKKCKS